MLLYINTAQRDFLRFALIDNKSEVFLFEKNIGNKQSENLLSFLDKILKKKRIKLSKISKIIVNRGPGSFTSVRIAIVLANTLSFSLKIPIIGIDNLDLEKKEDYIGLLKLKQGDEFIKPFYYKDANITKPSDKIKV